MAHYIPERVQLASQLEEVFLEFIHVVDPSPGTRLISYECLKGYLHSGEAYIE